MKPFLSAIILSFAASVGAQQASYTYTPQPAPYADPSPTWLTALNTPRLGTTFDLQVPATPNQGQYFITWSGSPVQIDLGPLGSESLGFVGYLLAMPELMVPTPAGSGPFSVMSIPVPLNSALLGVDFYNQVIRWTNIGCGGLFGVELRSITLSGLGHGVIGL